MSKPVIEKSLDLCYFLSANKCECTALKSLDCKDCKFYRSKRDKENIRQMNKYYSSLPNQKSSI